MFTKIIIFLLVLRIIIFLFYDRPIKLKSETIKKRMQQRVATTRTLEQINTFSINNFVNLFTPCSIEVIADIFNTLGFTDADIEVLEIKKATLKVLRILLIIDIIYVHNWGVFDPGKEEVSNVDSIIDYIDKKWIIGMKYADFYSLPMFRTHKWYVEKLEALGMNPTTNWEWFVENKIGDLKQWIEENRPEKN